MAKRRTKQPEESRLKAVSGVVIAAMPLLLILGGAATGLALLWQQAMDNPRYRIAGDTVSLAGAASRWPEAKREVIMLAKKLEGRCILSPTLIADIRADYERSPWVRRVCGLRRLFPNRLSIEFVLRAPVVQVRQNGYYWLVDRDCRLLPVDKNRTPKKNLPEVLAATPRAIARRPHNGERWQDQGIRDAIGVVETIQGSPVSEDLNIKKVLVHGGGLIDTLRRLRKRPRLDLETHEGVLIRWGTFNGGDLPDELLSGEKIWMLRDLIRREFSMYPGIKLDVRTKVAGYGTGGER